MIILLFVFFEFVPMTHPGVAMETVTESAARRRGGGTAAAGLAAAAGVVVLMMLGMGRAAGGAGRRAARLQTDKLFHNRQRQNLMHSLV